VIKNIFRRLTRSIGYEFVKCTPHEIERLSSTDRQLRDIIAERSIADFLAERIPKLLCAEINLHEAIFLGELIQGLKESGPIIEIGTLFGSSTRIMIAHKPRKTELITVDNYSWNPLNLSSDAHFAITNKNLLQAIHTLHVKQVRMDKNDFYAQYKGGPPALVFLDADHTYEETRKDIQWAQSVQSHVICGHDYNSDTWPGVVKAVQESGGPRLLIESLWVL
jgi:predicted O-methyltransferase YrrM